MTGRTHDLAAFTALSYIALAEPILHLSLGTVIIAFGANMIGGLTPDIDQPTAKLWNEIPAGSFFGKLISPLFGGHRFISHSIFGAILFGFLSYYTLQLASHTVLVNMTIIWWSFMIGYISHLIMDTITREGVPWFFPIPWKIGIPPFKDFRIKTGGLIEKAVVFPLLILVTLYIYYNNYAKVLTFFHHYIH
jgi:inner membrane protein